MKKNFNDIAVYISQDQKFHFKYDLPEGSLYEDGSEVHTLNNSDLADKKFNHWFIIDQRLGISKFLRS